MTLAAPGVPALPPSWTPRARLNRRLEAVDQHRLTVVTGPPGAGKTTLLAGWTKDRPDRTTAWLELEAIDNEPSRFWLRALAALRGVDPLLGADLFDAVDEDGPKSGDYADLLLRDVVAMPPAVVIVDNFHVINDIELVDSVEYLVRRLPPHVHLVLASRQEPGFPLHRLRVSGELVEIRERDLRFSVDEAVAFFAVVAERPVAPDEVETLVEHTEGWAAGLQLAALALADDAEPGDFAQRFGGHLHLVADYLYHEVLAGQPPDVMRFLLESSVLERMTGDLCLEVTGRPDAEQILASLAEANLFVVTLDSREGWYRYHRLFRDLLRHQLRHENPTQARQAHVSAAAWFERNGDVREAIHHLVAAGAYHEAFALGASTVIGDLSDGPSQGEPLLPAGLPDGYFEEDPYRIYALAVGLLGALRTSAAACWLHRLDLLMDDYPDSTIMRGRVEFLWALHDAILTDAAGVLNHCGRATELLGRGEENGLQLAESLPTAYPWLEAVDAAIPGQLAILAARAFLWLEEPDKARAALPIQVRAQAQSRDVAHLGTLAMVACREGRLREAYALARDALEEAERQNRRGSLATLDARLALGVMFWEQDDLDDAYEELDDALRLCRSAGYVRRAWEVEHHLVSVMIAQGRPAEALDRLRQLREADRRDPAPEGLLLRLNQVEISCRLALGDLQGATLILESIPAERRTPGVLARIDLCAGRPDRAAGRLTAAPAGRVSLGVDVERLALLARAQLQLGNRRQADDATRRAIDRGRPERHIWRVVEQTPELLPLLYEIAGRFPDMYVAELLAHAKRTGVTGDAKTPVPTLEPLTEREREILSHLTGHLTQHEIASGMYVSVNTLKTHINRVYRKLGAGSRSEAVALARGHGLV